MTVVSRCEGKGHKAYQRPSRKNLHIGVEKEQQKEEVANNEDGDETPQFNADDFVDSNEDNSSSMVLRRILDALKGKS